MNLSKLCVKGAKLSALPINKNNIHVLRYRKRRPDFSDRLYLYTPSMIRKLKGVWLLLVETKRIELSTSRMRTERSPS